MMERDKKQFFLEAEKGVAESNSTCGLSGWIMQVISHDADGHVKGKAAQEKWKEPFS